MAKKRTAKRSVSAEEQKEPSGPKVWERAWFPAALFALISCVYFSGFIFSDKIIYGYDAYDRIETTFGEKLEALGQPLWSRLMGGFPMSEEMRPQYFPAHLIYLFTSSYLRHLGWRYILTVFLAGWAMYLYLRELRVMRWAAVWGGIAYMSAPSFLSFTYAGHFAKMGVIALLPLMFFLLERGMRSGRLVYFAGLGAAIGIGAYSPHLQMLYYALLALGLYFLFRGGQIFWEDRSRGVLRAGCFALAVVLGLGLGAEGLFPSYLYTKTESKRAAGKEGQGKSPEEQLAFAQSWSLHPEEVGSLLVPEFSGFDDPQQGRQYYWGRNGFKHNSEYFGVLVLLLALVTVPEMRRRPLALFMGGLFVLVLAYALGGHTPVHWLGYHLLPGGKVLRTVGMAASVATFAACVLAGLGLQRLLDEEVNEESVLRRRLLYVGGALTGLALLVALAPRGVTDAWISLFYADILPAKRKILVDGYDWLARGGLLVALVVGMGTALLYFRRKLGLLPVVVGLCALALLDTWRIDRIFLKFSDPPSDPRGDNRRTVEFLERQEGPFRIFPVPDFQLLRQPGYRLHGADLVTGHHDFTIQRYDRLLREFGIVTGLLQEKYRNRREVPYTDEELLTAVLPLLNLVNARYIAAPHGIELRSELFPHIFDGERFGLYENRAALPWFYLVPSYQLVTEEERALELLGRGALDLRRVALLESAPAGELGDVDASLDGDRVEQMEYDPPGGHIRLRTISAGARLLVVSENYHSNWRVYVDGREAEILRANYVWKGLYLPAGEHMVEFRYRSRTLVWSRAASGLSLLVILGICGGELRNRRRAVEGPAAA
jgi:hypothetical protein